MKFDLAPTRFFAAAQAPRRAPVRWALAAALVLGSELAVAHSFGTPYNLPVPFWMYAYGATAALVLSFVVVAYFSSVPAAVVFVRAGAPQRTREAGTLHGGLLFLLRLVSLFALILAIVAGFVGSRNVFTNINMTLFWIVFALGFYYLVALVGDVYAAVNPWQSLVACVERFFPTAFAPRVKYPERFGYYPALLLYLAYIWIELFAHTQPRSLSVLLLVYTCVNLVGAAVVGKRAWFTYWEFLAVLFRLAGMLAPIEYVTNEERAAYRVRLRFPFVGLLQRPAGHLSLLLFVLFTLSSTAFDGIHETLVWVGLFWKGIYPLLDAAWHQPYLVFVRYYYYWQWLMLLVSPIVYLAVYAFFVWLAKLTAGSSIPLRTLLLNFAFSLVPIAFVYNVTHYYTLIASQGTQMLRMISDPFGLNWDLFGTARSMGTAIVLDAGTVWHTQVALILVGHIVGVYLAHAEAVRVFVDTRRAALSQLPMLLLMVLFTTLGLWILSLPIAAGQVVQPATTGG